MATDEQLQECMAQAEPTAQHRWLDRLVGEWTYEIEAPVPSGQQPQKLTGSESVRAIGELWVVADGRGEMPDGAEAQMMMCLGYDPQRQRFVGTWFGSMMTHLWVYDGELDAQQRVLTLYADGPALKGGGQPPKFKDVIELQGDHERMLTGHMLGEDGQWQLLCTARYRRQT